MQQKIFFSVGTLLNKLPLEDQFDLAKKAGFDGIDYVLSLNDLFRQSKKIHELSKKFKIPIKGIHIPLLLIPYCPEIFYHRLYKIISEFPECDVFNVHLSSFVTPVNTEGKGLTNFLTILQKSKLVITFESNPRSKIFQ